MDFDWLIASDFFRIFLYLELISFNLTTTGVYVWGSHLFILCAVIFTKKYFPFLPSVSLYLPFYSRDHPCRNRMVVGFITIYAISAYHH